MGPEGRSMAPAVGGLDRRFPKKSSLGINVGSLHGTPAPLKSDPACGEKSCCSGLPKQAIAVQSTLPPSRTPVRAGGKARGAIPACAALLRIVMPENPASGKMTAPALFL